MIYYSIKFTTKLYRFRMYGYYFILKIPKSFLGQPHNLACSVDTSRIFLFVVLAFEISGACFICKDRKTWLLQVKRNGTIVSISRKLFWFSTYRLSFFFVSFLRECKTSHYCVPRNLYTMDVIIGSTVIQSFDYSRT